LVSEAEFQRAYRSEIAIQSARNFQSRCQRYLVPAFGKLDLGSIRTEHLFALADELTAKGLHSATIKQILGCASRVLTRAHQCGLINVIPTIPRIRTSSEPRGGFSPDELLRLWRAARNLSKTTDTVGESPEKKKRPFSKMSPITPEICWLVPFAVNTFGRPSDYKNLQHKHIQLVCGTHTYLKLSPPRTKSHGGTIVSMRAAVWIYRKLVEITNSRGYGKPDDYVFMPEIPDRKKAMMALDYQFRRVLDASGLRKGQRGQIRTLYSLRHSAITMRLQYGKGIDLLTLARNARTSVAMVERFYASELTAEANIAMIQSKRTQLEYKQPRP
jgi:integrase